MSGSLTSLRAREISFNVRDGESGLRLEFVAVALTHVGSGRMIGGNTDKDGNVTLEVPDGRWQLEVGLIGYRPCRQTVTWPGDSSITLLLLPAESLAEVVVTARESRFSTGASLIDTTAMRHLQPSSFSDLLELLPGHVSHDPDMGSVNSIALRQAPNITPTDDYATLSLGTSFVIDGVPVNTGSQMITTPDASQTGRVAVGKGVDMRSLSTDDIESVEIVRGIPSAEYGELTSGLVNIKRKSGVSRLEARFKADTQSQLFYLGKGLKLNPSWNLNVGADYLDAKIDPRNNRENYKRVTASVRSDKRWNSTVFSLTWNSALAYTGTFERDRNDPDLTVNNTIDDYLSDNHTFRWNNTLSFTPVVKRLLREINLTAGVSYGDEHLHQQKHVASSRIMPLPVSTAPGSNYVGYLPMLYLAEYDVYGKPFTAYMRLSSMLRFTVGTLADELRGGVEWNMSKNYGTGPVYDLNRPLTTGNNSRPRSFSDVPAIQQVSSYLENRATFHAGRHTFMLNTGVRHTQLLHLDRRYSLHGKPYLDPRVTATWQFPVFYSGEHPVEMELTGGTGLHTKMPVAAYLYPDMLYSDFEQLNYYHNVEAYRVMNVMTYVDDMTNYGLKAARNFKWEVRADLSFRGSRLSVTYFREDMKNGFRRTGVVRRYSYNSYDASDFDPYAVDRAPVIEELPYIKRVFQGVRSLITNGSRTRKEGVEYTFQSARLKSLKTRMTVNGAYFRTINSSSQALWYKPSVIVNNNELQYVGRYDDVDGSICRSFNTNVMFDTDLPALGLNFSLSVQNQWFTSRQTLRRDGVPTDYLDPDGVMHPFTEEDMNDPYLSQLLRRYTESSFERLTVPLATAFNLKATKTFWNKRIGLALYVNRLLTIEPDYERYGMTIRRYSSPYFGMELNLRL